MAFFSPASSFGPGRRTRWRPRRSARCPASRRPARAAARRWPADRCRARRRRGPAPRNTTTKRCSLTGSTNTSTPGIFTSRSLIGQRLLSSRRDAAGAAIGDAARGVERAEVAADGHVVRAKLEADAGGLQRPAADDDISADRSRTAQMPRPAARRDARLDRECSARSTPRAASASRFGVLGRLQLGQPARLPSAIRPARRRRASRSWSRFCDAARGSGRACRRPCSASGLLTVRGSERENGNANHR